MGIRLKIVSRDGDVRVVDAEIGASLMEVLRAEDFDVLGTCGGMCSCGSCHIYASEQILQTAGPAGEDEQDMLDALADVVEVRPGSRLSCQIRIVQELDEAEVEVAPQL